MRYPSKKAIETLIYSSVGTNKTASNHKYNGQDFNQGFSVNGTIDKVNYLGIFYNGWRFIKPQEGCMLWVMNKSAFYQYTRSSWNPILLTNS